MKIELIKVTIEIDGEPKTAVVGWKHVAENKDDELMLGSIRNLQFGGIDDTAMAYNGMIESKINDNHVGELSWVQKIFTSSHRFNNRLPEIKLHK